MKQRHVVTTPEADEDARRIDQWWIQNRGAAPNLFLEELADALALLAMEAGVGVRQPNRAIPGLRRYLLRARRSARRFDSLFQPGSSAEKCVASLESQSL